MLDNVADHIASSAYSDADRAKILFWMSAEGSTGDAVPYKGTVSTSPFDFTISTVPGGQWDVFKRAAWTHMNGKIKGNAKTAAIRLLMNPGDDGDGFQWILDNVSDGWMKAGSFTHSYSIPGELQYSARLESLRNSPTRNNRTRGEFEDTDSNVWWQTAYRQNYMAMATQCLHANIDILNISSATAQTNTLISDPYALTFFSKYAGIRTALSSNIAFIYFRDEIDILDATRFPENVYGTHHYTQYIRLYHKAKCHSHKCNLSCCCKR
jgi:hypothetical protein